MVIETTRNGQEQAPNEITGAARTAHRQDGPQAHLTRVNALEAETMSRKDYEKIAAAFAKIMPRADAIRLEPGEYSEEQIRTMMGERSMWVCTVKATADMLAEDNPRFQRDRFYAACGMAK